MLNKCKIFCTISIIGLLSTPIISNATVKSGERLVSSCIVDRNYAQGSMTSYCQEYFQRIEVSSAIKSGGTTLKSSRNVSYQGKYPATTYMSGVGSNASVQNGYNYGGSWNYTNRSETIYY